MTAAMMIPDLAQAAPAVAPLPPGPAVTLGSFTCYAADVWWRGFAWAVADYSFVVMMLFVGRLWWRSRRRGG